MKLIWAEDFGNGLMPVPEFVAGSDQQVMAIERADDNKLDPDDTLEGFGLGK